MSTDCSCPWKVTRREVRRGRRASKDCPDGRILNTRLTAKLKTWQKRSLVPAQAQAHNTNYQLDSCNFAAKKRFAFSDDCCDFILANTGVFVIKSFASSCLGPKVLTDAAIECQISIHVSRTPGLPALVQKVESDTFDWTPYTLGARLCAHSGQQPSNGTTFSCCSSPRS